MRSVLQRAYGAAVHVEGQRVAGFDGEGILALVGVAREDTTDLAQRMATKIAELRILRQERSVLEAEAPVLVVSQFTLHGDTRKGRRPSWGKAAAPEVAEPLIELVADGLRERGLDVATGVFGADMRVELVNDGPVTLVVDID